MRTKHTWVTFAGIVLLAAACENRRPTALPETINPKAMENEEHLTLQTGEVREVTLPSRGAAGLQLIGRSDNSSIIQVERKELTDTTKQMPVNVGGSLPAVFAIKAVQEGETTVTFAEIKPWDKNFGEIIQKRIRIVVRER